MVVEKNQIPPTLLGVTAIKPVERHGWEAIRYIIYNPETGAIFTRTPKSWFLIIFFYCCFYGCLAAFWYGMLQLFFMTLPMDQPKFTLSDSLITDNPGLGLRPKPRDARIDSSLIFLKKDARDETPSEDFETDSNVDWAKRLETFANLYKNTTGMKDCSDGSKPRRGGEACIFSIDTLKECSRFPYGYELTENEDAVRPCVYLKPNRLFNWEPEPYDPEDLENLTEDIPERVKNLIQRNPNKLYIDCEGENPYDREGLEGNILYFPEDQGIPFNYFPYTQSGRNYHNPVVAMRLKYVDVGRLYHIECKLWGKGIKHNRKDRTGQAHFELLIE